ncbi:MAG TPA: DinB family protein [Albitalea sp.]|uniref:DinB family protein n=1 Tax=Piscinibacter sp. TaxID=1903157 RepID=UPI002ED03A93
MQALIDQLLDFPERVAALVEAVPVTGRRRRPADGSFSLVEHLCHLRDLEREGFAVRIRRIVEEDLPELAEIDGSALAVERDYQAQDLATALRDFRAARAATVALLREHQPRHADRKGIFGGFGVITLAALAEGIAAHDAGHRAEMQALVTLPS